jgi:methionine sulfoxide reductase heme-binding subunit
VQSLIQDRAIWYVMRGSGVVSLLLLTGVMTLGIATAKRWRPAGRPRFVTAALHRSIALLAVVFVAIHVVTAVLDPYAVVGVTAVFVPFVAARSAFWIGAGTISLDLLVATIVTSLLRVRIGVRLWRTVHLLAYLSWPIAVAHGLGAGSDGGTLWLRVLASLCVGVVAVALTSRLRAADGGKHLEPATSA